MFYEYKITEKSWQLWEVTENGMVLANLHSKSAAEGWLKSWVANGRRDDFYNMVGK